MKNAKDSDNNRINYFDIAKGIGIILVIIGHIEYVPAPIRFYIVTFHMPLFFVVSGMLMNLTDEKNREMKPLVIKKLKRIMLPYLIFSVLYPVIDLLYYFITGNGDPYGTLGTNISDTLMLYGYSVLWFLPTAFFGEVIFLLIIKGSMKVYEKYSDLLALVISFALSIAMFFVLGNNGNHFIQSFVRFFIAAFLIAAGNIIYPILKRNQLKTPLKIMAALLFLVILLLFHGRNGIVDMHFAVYGNIFMFYLDALLGSMGVILISMSMENISTFFLCRILIFYGINSLFVMITHINFYVLYFSEVFSFKMVEYVPHAKSAVFNIMTVCCVLIAEFVMIKIYDFFKRMFLARKGAAF